MFQFTSEDASRATRSRRSRSQSHRMTGLRHNPYVGTFHGKNVNLDESCSNSSVARNMLEDSRSNPMVGLFRHSPAGPGKTLGLKALLRDDKSCIGREPLASTNSGNVPAGLFLKNLREIPTRVYSTSSINADNESVSELNTDEPTCPICLDVFTDGDAIHTFACSHCFHKKCVNKWIAHRCLDNCEDVSFNCPKCRQNHVSLSEAGSSMSSLAEGISSMSFMQVGEGLGARDIGYDFMSDMGSEITSVPPASPRQIISIPSTPNRLLIRNLSRNSIASPVLQLRTNSIETFPDHSEPSSPASAVSLAEVDDDALEEVTSMRSPMDRIQRASRFPPGRPHPMILGITGMHRFGTRGSIMSRGAGGGLLMSCGLVPFLSILPAHADHNRGDVIAGSGTARVEAPRPLSPIAEVNVSDTSMEDTSAHGQNGVEPSAGAAVVASEPVESHPLDTGLLEASVEEEHCLNESTYSDCGYPLGRRS